MGFSASLFVCGGCLLSFQWDSGPPVKKGHTQRVEDEKIYPVIITYLTKIKNIIYYQLPSNFYAIDIMKCIGIMNL